MNERLTRDEMLRKLETYKYFIDQQEINHCRKMIVTNQLGYERAFWLVVKKIKRQET